MAFAEFLSGRQELGNSVEEEATPLEPKLVERPAKESVVKAIKRLSASYFMLQRDKLLDETSSLMMSHIMQGRDALEVIEELEALFDKHYQDYRNNF
ncbi:MAG: Crp/Fnr family transcriptional regulator [Candidatus Thiodiazotropha sp. 6PLUC3]